MQENKSGCFFNTVYTTSLLICRCLRSCKKYALSVR